MDNAFNSKTEKLVRADFSDRFVAWAIDLVITWVPTFMIAIFIYLTNRELTENYTFRIITSFMVFLLFMGYFGVYAYENNGQTIGKKRLDIKVVDLKGNDLTLKHFLLRVLIADGVTTIFKWLPIFGAISPYWGYTYLLALREDRRTLVDLIARTQVIKIADK